MFARVALGIVLAGLVGAPAALATDRAVLAYELSGEFAGIYSIQADGSGRQLLADLGFSATWSPDGERLAFVRDRLGQVLHPSALYVRDLKAGTERRITGDDSNALAPAWSPDGSRIAYAASPPFDAKARDTGPIKTVAATGGQPQTVTQPPKNTFDTDPAWSPDGKRLAFGRNNFSSADQPNEAIFVVDLTTGITTKLTNDGRHPSWSPDGGRIAFVTTRDHNGATCFEDCFSAAELYVMASDGTTPVRLTRTTADEQNPSWSPDASKIAFDSDRNSPETSEGGGREIYTVNPDGSCMTWLTNGSADARGPAWRPGAGLSTDAGGCGAVPRAPSFDVRVDASARKFRRYPLFWLGQSFERVLLSEASPDWFFVYGDCGVFDPSDCGKWLQVQNMPICKHHPLGLGGGPGIETFQTKRRFLYRGVVAATFGRENGWDVYTGRTAIRLYDPSPGRVKRIIRALTPLRAGVSGRLAPPAFPAKRFWVPVDAATAAYRSAGSVRSAAQRLGISTGAVRDRLAWARLLKRLGKRRTTRC